MSTVTPVTVVPEESQDGVAVHASIDDLKIGIRILNVRLDRLLERTADWGLYLGDDEERLHLVLMAVGTSKEALEHCLSGPAAEGKVIERATFRSLHVAVLVVDEQHCIRFAGQLESLQEARDKSSTLPSQRNGVLVHDSLFAARYRVGAVLGRGATGEVYRAHDQTLQRAVALKILRLDERETHAHREEAKRRLLREARVVSALKHPHIVELYDASENAGLPYLVLELCEGGNLRKAMMAPATQEERERWVTEIAQALACAHDQGIVHRDIKPENILLTTDRLVKVADFGIAKAKERRDAPNTTLGIVGTPPYMAPEQLIGSAVDGRADQYAWGLVAYELLTKRHPRLRESTSPPANNDQGLPPNLSHVLARAMTTDPAGRYSDFHELLSELRPAPQRTKRRFALAAMALIAASSIISIAWTIWRHPADTSARSAPPAIVPSANSADGHASLFAAPPETVRAEARTSYEAAIQLWKDASPQEALDALQRTTELDPSFAQAHLLYALLDQVTPSARQHHQLAAQYRTKLSRRQLDLLEALTPSLQDPMDLEETRTRLEHLEASVPQDPDISLFIASRYLEGWNGKRALPAAERAIGVVQPARPIARLMRARALAKLDRFDEARAEYRDCISSSLSATGCLRWHARLEAGAGRCQDVERLGRRLMAAAPNNPDGYYFLAGGLAGQSAASSAMRDALNPRWQLAPQDERPWLRLEETFYIQVISGAFDDAERTLTEWEAEAQHFTDAEHHGMPAGQRLLLNLELGRKSRVATLAHAYLERSRAWTESGLTVFDIEAERFLYFAGAISREEFAHFRDDWLLAAQHRRIGWQDMDLYQWYEAFVQPVFDRDDALLAISRRPPGLVPDREIMNPEAMFRVGRMYLLAGQAPEALPFLKMSVDACFYRFPIPRMWARLEYARALVQTGEPAEAYKQLQTVTQRWGRDTRSATGTEARELVARLSLANTRKETVK
ncbi:protein kinase [Pendulispora rubella]|uniref:non-specific serine/threonine protein kinase n=1 Tax=Pendulispora rubella TaxID=2741070 RepID=A0ABZ2LN81_9BACT